MNGNTYRISTIVTLLEWRRTEVEGGGPSNGCNHLCKPIWVFFIKVIDQSCSFPCKCVTYWYFNYMDVLLIYVFLFLQLGFYLRVSCSIWTNIILYQEYWVSCMPNKEGASWRKIRDDTSAKPRGLATHSNASYLSSPFLHFTQVGYNLSIYPSCVIL